MIGRPIACYYCVILKFVTLHDAINTIQNGIICFSVKRNKNMFLKKTGLKKTNQNRWAVFFKKYSGFYQPWFRACGLNFFKARDKIQI